jgi:hypothetical protein
MPGQPAIGVATTSIGIDAYKLDVLDSGLASNRVIEASAPFSVETEFKLDGLFALWLVSLPLTFTATYYAESFGPGYEGLLATKTGTTVAGQLTYNTETRAAVAGGTLTPGTYKLTVVISFAGAAPVPMTAFFEGEVIQIF